ncbi:MAG: trehalose utilization protein ThuA [Planctomycetes bacterium]|nr:trehalose utilization protein ThuA [Planctomycetota bacterium]
MTIHVTIWNEYRHEKQDERVRAVYPNGMHAAIREGIEGLLGDGVSVRCATLDEPEHGLSESVLARTEVLIWWGHKAHNEVNDDIVARVHKRVLEGMGLIVLHSGHYSKIFKRLMGTGCGLRWREAGEMERVWVVDPSHPITDGLDACFELPHTEMYGEHFDIPAPDALVFISWYAGGEVFRSGCCWKRGKGRVFYFAPGHETYPIYFDPNIRRVIANAVCWARQSSSTPYRHDAVNIKEPPNPF